MSYFKGSNFWGIDYVSSPMCSILVLLTIYLRQSPLKKLLAFKSPQAFQEHLILCCLIYACSQKSSFFLVITVLLSVSSNMGHKVSSFGAEILKLFLLSFLCTERVLFGNHFFFLVSFFISCNRQEACHSASTWPLSVFRFSDWNSDNSM